VSQKITVAENSAGTCDGWNGAQINQTMVVIYYNMLQAEVPDMNDRVILWHPCLAE